MRLLWNGGTSFDLHGQNNVKERIQEEEEKERRKNKEKEDKSRMAEIEFIFEKGKATKES